MITKTVGRPYRAWLCTMHQVMVMCDGLATQAVGLGFLRLPLRGEAGRLQRRPFTRVMSAESQRSVRFMPTRF